MTVSTRFALPGDLPQVITLCALHAAYEQLPYEYSGQEERLLAALAGPKPKLYCLVACYEQEVLGYATYMKQYATWEAGEYIYMDCLFVQEKARCRGIGADLIERIKAEATALGCLLIQWQTPPFNQRAINFYHRIGACSKTKERFFLPL